MGISRFLEDGRSEIDNDVVERAIRPIALPRKNALFAGSDGGAEHWVIITHIVAGHPQSGLDDLYVPQQLRAVAGKRRLLWTENPDRSNQAAKRGRQAIDPRHYERFEALSEVRRCIYPHR